MTIPVKDGKKHLDSKLVTYILKRKDAEAQSLLQTVDGFQNLVDDTSATLLHYTAEYGNAIMTQYLIDAGCNVNSLDEWGRSPLMLAVKGGYVATIEALLKANADVEVRDSLRRTILESVLQPGAVSRSPEVITLFLNKVKDMCSDDDILMAKKFIQVECDLIKVIGLCRPGITKVMLEHGCSVDERDLNGDTALHIAVESMNLDNIQLLIWYGARINAKGCNGRVPLFKYNMMFDDTVVKLDILKFLLKEGASFTTPDFFGATPLIFLCSGADKEVLQVVMRYDVDLCVCNIHGQNLLHYLVDNKNPGVLETIRGKKFEVDSRNSTGFTPLLSAAKNYDLEKVQFLLEHGADVNFQSASGHTPLLLVFMNRLEHEKNINDIIEVLLQHGADCVATMKSGMSIFDLAAENDFFCRIKSVITNIVMHEAIGKPINKSIREKINANFVFKYHYEKCKQNLRQMRYKIVHGSVSLFKLLFEDEDKLMLYARNLEFEAKFQRLMERVKDIDKYILDILNTRVNKVIQTTNLKEKSALGICRMTGLPISTRHTILYKIINYLSHQDLVNLGQV